MLTSALPLDPPSEMPLKLSPPLPPLVSSCTCVIEPRTSSCAGVIRPICGALLPPAIRPLAARSCSAIASFRISESPSTMNFPFCCKASVMIVVKPSPTSHCPDQPDSFGNLLTVIE
jgi:hypothetical protein